AIAAGRSPVARSSLARVPSPSSRSSAYLPPSRDQNASALSSSVRALPTRPRTFARCHRLSSFGALDIALQRFDGLVAMSSLDSQRLRTDRIQISADRFGCDRRIGSRCRKTTGERSRMLEDLAHRTGKWYRVAAPWASTRQELK